MKFIIISLFLFTNTIMALSSKVKEPKNISGSSKGYTKSGSFVTMNYTTQQVKIGELCEVKVTLKTKTKAKQGDIEILLSLDKALKEEESVTKEHHFIIQKDKKSHTLHFLVSSKIEGLFYIRLYVTLNDKISSFAIPIYVGEYQKSVHSKSLQKTKNGSTIIIYKARETIR